MNNNTVKVILGERRAGLTSTLHSEIHDQVVKGQRRNLVVFPSANYIHAFVRTWHDDFPFVPVPDYTLIGNLLKIRGMQYQCIYVEDVQNYEEGIYDPRLELLYISLFNNDTVEVLFTASKLPLNGRTHSANIKPADVLVKTRKRLWNRR